MTPPTNTIVSLMAVTGGYIMEWTDLGCSRFPYDEDGDGPQNIGLLSHLTWLLHQDIPDFRFKTSV